jgi:hypothetical protein
VEQGDEETGDDQAARESEAAVPGRAEQHAADDRRPQAVADRRQHPTQELGVHEVGQGEAHEVAVLRHDQGVDA